MHALIIEDDFFVALAVEEALGRIGYASFDEASDVESAIAAASARCPDLIVADQRLDSGLGTEAVLAICAGKSISVVFVTATAADVRERIPGALIVTKPFTMPALSAAVSMAVAHPFECARQ